MNSKQVKAAFQQAGIRVRVADQGLKFRICRLDEQRHEAASFAIAASLGMTDSLGARGAQVNQPYEMVAYKAGAIVRI